MNIAITRAESLWALCYCSSIGLRLRWKSDPPHCHNPGLPRMLRSLSSRSTTPARTSHDPNSVLFHADIRSWRASMVILQESKKLRMLSTVWSNKFESLPATFVQSPDLSVLHIFKRLISREKCLNGHSRAYRCFNWIWRAVHYHYLTHATFAGFRTGWWKGLGLYWSTWGWAYIFYAQNIWILRNIADDGGSALFKVELR